MRKSKLKIIIGIAGMQRFGRQQRRPLAQFDDDP
jgi:hypothetical protein